MAPRLRLFVCAVVGLLLLALNVRAARVYDDERPPVVLQDARAGPGEALAESASELTWGRHLYEDDYEEIYENEEYEESAGQDPYHDDDVNDYEENEYDPWDDDGSGEPGAGDYEEEEELGADLGFDDDDDDYDSGELGEEEWEEEDFGDYYDDGNEDTEFFDFYEDRDDGVADPQDEDDPEDVWGFEDGDEAFTSFCESATSDLIKEDVAGDVCDILVTGLDENIAKTHLHVDGVYKPTECLNGYLKYVPAEGEDARMIAFDVDFEEWGFYNGSEVAQESLILHGSQFSARVPQEVEAWYCDWKVCETDTENEHFWTPITTARIACITPEEEEQRVRMMGKRKNEIIFPDEKDRTKNKPHKIDTSENWRDPSTGGGGAYEYSAVDSAMLSIVVMIAGSIVIGIPLYIYLKQSGASQASLSLRARLRQVRTGGLPSSARKAKVRFAE